MNTNTTPTIPRLLLDTPAAAQALSISPRTLWQLTKDGEIPCIRIGRSVRYSIHDLEAWIEQRKTITVRKEIT